MVGVFQRDFHRKNQIHPLFFRLHVFRGELRFVGNICHRSLKNPVNRIDGDVGGLPQIHPPDLRFGDENTQGHFIQIGKFEQGCAGNRQLAGVNRAHGDSAIARRGDGQLRHLSIHQPQCTFGYPNLRFCHRDGFISGTHFGGGEFRFCQRHGGFGDMVARLRLIDFHLQRHRIVILLPQMRQLHFQHLHLRLRHLQADFGGGALSLCHIIHHQRSVTALVSAGGFFLNFGGFHFRLRFFHLPFRLFQLRLHFLNGHIQILRVIQQRQHGLPNLIGAVALCLCLRQFRFRHRNCFRARRIFHGGKIGFRCGNGSVQLAKLRFEQAFVQLYQHIPRKNGIAFFYMYRRHPPAGFGGDDGALAFNRPRPDNRYIVYRKRLRRAAAVEIHPHRHD